MDPLPPLATPMKFGATYQSEIPKLVRKREEWNWTWYFESKQCDWKEWDFIWAKKCKRVFKRLAQKSYNILFLQHKNSIFAWF